MPLEEAKIRARQQWGQDPCGAAHGREHQFGTREFFDAVERHRYTEYAAWIPTVMGFDQFAGARLLEVGCGMGTDLLQFARAGAHCTGIDLTPRSIEITRQHFAVYGESGDFLIADAEILPFADESYDVIYSNGVLLSTPDTAKAVREIHRVLRPGGTAKVMLYHRHSLHYWYRIIFRLGLCHGELLRGNSPGEIMSRYAEYSEHDGRPLVKVYSRKEVRALFRLFSKVKVEIEQLNYMDLPVFVRAIPGIPQRLLPTLRRTVGWNLIITAQKCIILSSLIMEFVSDFGV